MKVEIDPIRLERLNSITLEMGNHSNNTGNLCFNEAAAWLAGELHSDKPRCVSKVIRRFTMALNDNLDDSSRQQFKPYVVRVIGTAGDGKPEIKRAFMCVDWAVRECLPLALDAAQSFEWSAKLRTLPEISDLNSANAAANAVDDAADDAAKTANAAIIASAAYAAKAANYVSVDYASAASAAFAANAAVYARIDILDLALPLLDRLIRVTEE